MASILTLFVCIIQLHSFGKALHEELFLKFVGDGKVYSYFQFTTLWNRSFAHDQYDHSDLFPRSLAEIIRTYDVQELHVSLTEGQWRHRYWGYPIVEAPSGAELWVWFRKGTANVREKWKGLTAALSGLLCASFNFIDEASSVNPKFSFKPNGLDDDDDGTVDVERLRYASLPREIACTENLTPWKKLLPCDCSKGLSTLLNARYIHNTNYHSIGIHYRQICNDRSRGGCGRPQIELKQTVSLVYDLVVLDNDAREWSMRKLFGIALFDKCPLSISSTVFVDVSDNDVELSKEPNTFITKRRGGRENKYAVYDVDKFDSKSAFNMLARKKKNHVYEEPILHANRYIRGYGKEIGGIVTTIRNNHREAINVTYFENIPWYVPLYYHTLKLVVSGSSSGEEIVPIAKYYSPGRIRSRPYHLEVIFQIPARSVVDVSFDFDYMFLKWQEYPPDANHGFYVGSAVITAKLPYARNYLTLPRVESTIINGWNVSYYEQDGFVVQLRTESFVLGLPTPDFSMPYNVICLSCTVVALAFGPIHNIATKRLRLAKRSNKGKIRQFLIENWERLNLFRRSAPVTEDVVAAVTIESEALPE